MYYSSSSILTHTQREKIGPGNPPISWISWYWIFYALIGLIWFMCSSLNKLLLLGYIGVLINLAWVTYFFPGVVVDSGSPEACGLKVWGRGGSPKQNSGYQHHRIELCQNNSNYNKYPIHSPLKECPTSAPKQQMFTEPGKRRTNISKLKCR